MVQKNRYLVAAIVLIHLEILPHHLLSLSNIKEKKVNQSQFTKENEDTRNHATDLVKKVRKYAIGQ